MNGKNETLKLDTDKLKEHKSEPETFDDVLAHVYKAFGNTKSQDQLRNIVEYFLSGEPAYITRNDEARNMVCRYDRYDLLSHIIKSYYEDILKIK